MNNPIVSVIMAVHNGENYLGKAVESILGQTFIDFEFIIIDDGSTDGSLEIITNYAKIDTRIRVFQNAEKLALSKSLNKSISMARGKYLARMDADDISFPDRLEKQTFFLDNHPEIGVVGGQIRKIDQDGCITGEIKLQVVPALVKWDLCFGSSLAHPAVMMRKELITLIGGYSEEMKFAQDYDLWRRLAKTTRLTNLGDYVLYYRLHAVNKSKEYLKIQSSFAQRTQELILLEYFDINHSHEFIELFSKPNPTEQEIKRRLNYLVILYRIYKKINRLTIFEKHIICRNLGFRIFRLTKMCKFSLFKIRSLLLAVYFSPRVFVNIVRSIWVDFKI